MLYAVIENAGHLCQRILTGPLDWGAAVKEAERRKEQSPDTTFDVRAVSGDGRAFEHKA